MSSDVRVHWQSRDCGLLFKQAIYGPKENRKIDCTCVPSSDVDWDGAFAFSQKCQMSHSTTTDCCMANFKTSNPVFPTKCDTESHAAKQNILNGITVSCQGCSGGEGRRATTTHHKDNNRNQCFTPNPIIYQVVSTYCSKRFCPIRHDYWRYGSQLSAMPSAWSLTDWWWKRLLANVHRKIQILYQDKTAARIIETVHSTFWKTSTSIDCSLWNKLLCSLLYTSAH